MSTLSGEFHSTYRVGVIGVAIWFTVGIIYFAAVGRHKLILSPEEEFALEAREKDQAYEKD